jgi:penicillin amidase
MGAPIRPRAGYDKIGAVALSLYGSGTRKSAWSCEDTTLDQMGGEYRHHSRRIRGAYWRLRFYRAMPAYSGTERLPGLASEARVWRDARRPTFCGSMDDAARALGYLHASERMFQMDILRRVGQGRMAESAALIFCPSISSFAPWASIARPRRAFRRFRPGRRSGLRLCRGRQRLPGEPRAPPEFLLVGDSRALSRPTPGDWEDRGLPTLTNFKLKLLRARLIAKLGRNGQTGSFPARGRRPITLCLR